MLIGWQNLCKTIWDTLKCLQNWLCVGEEKCSSMGTESHSRSNTQTTAH